MFTYLIPPFVCNQFLDWLIIPFVWVLTPPAHHSNWQPISYFLRQLILAQNSSYQEKVLSYIEQSHTLISSPPNSSYLGVQNINVLICVMCLEREWPGA